MNLGKLFIVLIAALFLVTRFYKITSIPLSVYWDEASIGYNAFSIAQTGKDEWGDFFPIHFRAFGEFKLPVYIYTTSIIVYLFGLNEFTVRLAAVLFSLGVILIVFLLAKRLFNEAIGLWSSFFLSISPWFFIFSRTGYEVTAGLMFYLLGIYLFIKTRFNGWGIFLSILCFVLSAYSYNSFRLVTPLTGFILVIFEFIKLKQIIKQKIPLLFTIAILILSIIPIYRLYVYDSGNFRLKAVAASHESIIPNYFSHFNPRFLFVSGDSNLRSQQAGFGQLYFPESFFLIIGFLYLVSRKSKIKWLPILFLLIGPIPAAITKESPHALRSLSAVPFIHIISAVGVSYLGQILRKKYITNFVVVVIFLLFFLNYFKSFLTTYPAQSADDWQYGYKKLFTEVNLKFAKQDRILVSEKSGQPYIFALFYLRYDPEKFRREVVRNNIDKWGFSTIKKFGSFDFGDI